MSFVGQVVLQVASPFITDRYGRRIGMWLTVFFMLIVSRECVPCFFTVPYLMHRGALKKTGHHPRDHSKGLESVSRRQAFFRILSCVSRNGHHDLHVRSRHHADAGCSIGRIFIVVRLWTVLQCRRTTSPQCRASSKSSVHPIPDADPGRPNRSSLGESFTLSSSSLDYSLWSYS